MKKLILYLLPLLLCGCWTNPAKAPERWGVSFHARTKSGNEIWGCYTLYGTFPGDYVDSAALNYSQIDTSSIIIISAYKY
jgi:hypothetical protein